MANIFELFIKNIQSFQVRLVAEPRLEIERMIRLCSINKNGIYPNQKS
jgi:hypothetical protein